MKHDEKKEYTVRPVECSTRPIHYDPKLCIGCNRCVDTCQCDILMPNQEKGKPPVVMYPGCLLYTSPNPRDKRQSRMPSSA